MAYTTNKKPGGLTQVTSLGDSDNLVVDQSGDVKRATVTQLTEKVFDGKTAKTTVDGSEVVIVRQTDDSLRQVALDNVVRDGLITNAKVSASAAIADTKLATINTAGKVTNDAVQAVSTNTPNRIVARDGSGNFSAGTITATLSGNASTATAATALATGRTISLTGDITYTSPAFDGSANVTAAATIANDAVTNAKIASGIDAGKLTTGTLPIARIADGSVTNSKLASDIDAGKLTAGTLPIARIADDSITAAKLDGISSLNTQTGNYTLVLSDAGKVIDMNASTDATLTIPSNASVAFGIGSTIIVQRRGSGDITLAAANGTTIRSATSQFSTITGDAATDVTTVTGSSFVANQIIRFSVLTGGAGLSVNTDYYVISPSTNTFKVSSTSGGSEINFTTNITAGTLAANMQRIGARFAAVALIKVGTDEWILSGNLKA